MGGHDTGRSGAMSGSAMDVRDDSKGKGRQGGVRINQGCIRGA